MKSFAGLIAGLLFGLGLDLSGMLDPARVLGFLDFAGHWDPSLAFVPGGAVSISSLGWQIARRVPHPALAHTFDLPKATRIDAPLIGSAVLFGTSWGLAGLCPGHRRARPRSSQQLYLRRRYVDRDESVLNRRVQNE